MVSPWLLAGAASDSLFATAAMVSQGRWHIFGALAGDVDVPESRPKHCAGDSVILAEPPVLGDAVLLLRVDISAGGSAGGHAHYCRALPHRAHGHDRTR